MKRLCFPAALLVGALVFNDSTRADDLKAMEGKWKIEKAIANGEEIESDTLKAVLLTITGERYTVLVKDKLDAGTLKLDETQKPKAMDATDTEGDDVGKVTKAIYELSGDTMRVCYALKGGERPTEFATKPDSQLLLITYKREK
jgi:uncharacterized protein (TIGR03067 family)